MPQTFTNPFSVYTTYNSGDTVTYAGKMYRALVTTTGTSPLNNTVWTLVSSSFAYSGTWALGTTYQIGQYVQYSNTTFVSLANTNIGNQPDISVNYWRNIGNNYNTIVTSQPGDMQYEGNTAPQRLPIGSPGQILTVYANSVPGWANNLTTNITLPGNLIANTVTSNTYIKTTLLTANTVNTTNI